MRRTTVIELRRIALMSIGACWALAAIGCSDAGPGSGQDVQTDTPAGIGPAAETRAGTDAGKDAETETDTDSRKQGRFMHEKSIIGTWRKATSESCAAQYPDELQFVEGGIYMSKAPPGEFTVWQSGDYELGEDRVKMQMANDAMQGYDYAIDTNGVLSFTDAAGCRISYRRSEGASA